MDKETKESLFNIVIMLIIIAIVAVLWAYYVGYNNGVDCAFNYLEDTKNYTFAYYQASMC